MRKTLEFKIVNRDYPEGRTSYNAIAEIAGSDKKDEVITRTSTPMNGSLKKIVSGRRSRSPARSMFWRCVTRCCRGSVRTRCRQSNLRAGSLPREILRRGQRISD